MPLTGSRVVEDAYFGDLAIVTDDRRVEVSGESIPTAVITRAPGVEPDPTVPIGTRDPAHLTASVGGATADLVPGRGKWSRRSYRIGLTLGGEAYAFRPNSSATTRLRRGRTALADFSLDEVTGEVLVYWLPDPAAIRPADAALGYALSVAFRTGALSLPSMLARGVEHFFPG